MRIEPGSESSRTFLSLWPRHERSPVGVEVERERLQGPARPVENTRPVSESRRVLAQVFQPARHVAQDPQEDVHRRRLNVSPGIPTARVCFCPKRPGSTAYIPAMARPKKPTRTRKRQSEWLLSGRIYGDNQGPDAPHYLVEVITGDPPQSHGVFIGTDTQRKEVDLAILLRLMTVELPGVEPVDQATLDALKLLRRHAREVV